MQLFSKYHKGELQAQEYAGETKQAKFNGQAIENNIIEGAISFISEQEYAIVSITDEKDNVWSSVLSGDKGFLNATNPKTIIMDMQMVDIDERDVFWKVVEKNKRIGLLIIELASRRRLRVNGKVARINKNHIEISVHESYPNCMKYIQRRQITNRNTDNKESAKPATTGTTLNHSQQSIIQSADTFFIGSSNPKGNLDISHRGGEPGFIEIINDNKLRIPDYKGNSMFNTLGNFIVNNKAGIVFWDFESGKVLQLIGSANINWQAMNQNSESADTGRYWEFIIHQWIEKELPRVFTWEFLDYSLHNPKFTQLIYYV